MRAEFKSDLHQGLATVNQRIDRLVLVLIGGFVVLLRAVVGVTFIP